MFVLLAGGNVLAWAWALSEAHREPMLLGSGALAYAFGLRHAFDADHIASIDNVTRSLARDASAPATVGLWFALGHSTVVIAACTAIAMMTSTAHQWLPRLATWGGLGGSIFSISFLLVAAGINAASLSGLMRAWQGRQPMSVAPLQPRGCLAAILGSLLLAVRRPWHMLAIGFLFGLGFDTASEIGLLGLSAETALRMPSHASIMLLAVLFTAGMSLADATDGAIMARAYGWALERPRRRLTYNLIVTGISIIAALAVAAAELGNLAREQYGLHGAAWRAVAWTGNHSGFVGCLMVALLLGCWMIALFGRPKAVAIHARSATTAVERARRSELDIDAT
ncbi:HoxN/HupN/NixA family nickel/cobalt transporter [Dyella japonica]|uniref:Nickel/cobalt efflux system n=1 Tax=Dyella japonica TaxID=231455 RepID=A0ABV2K3E4_9GAMM